MQSVWVVGSADDIMKIPFSESEGYFTYGGDVYGNATFSPSIYEYFDSTTHQCGLVEEKSEDTASATIVAAVGSSGSSTSDIHDKRRAVHRTF